MSARASELRHLPSEVREYLHTLRDALISALSASEVVQIWVIGSAAHPSGYRRGLSDLDVTVVTRSNLPQSTLSRIPQLCSHSVLPCPASKLEVVAYAYQAVHLDEPILPYNIALNFNTGRTLPEEVVRYGNNPDDSPHWFILDIAAAHTSNLPLLDGPSYSEIFTPKLESRQVLQAIQMSIRWHIDNEATSSNAVLNACRGWRRVCQGVFGIKLQGGQFALSRLGYVKDHSKEVVKVRQAGQGEKAVHAAMQMVSAEDRQTGDRVDRGDADALYALIAAEVDGALQEGMRYSSA